MSATRHRCARAALGAFLTAPALSALTALTAQQAPPWHLDRALLEAEIEHHVSRSARDIRLGIWVGDASGRTACALREDERFPAASAIKTALLVEVLAQREKSLEDAPRELRSLCDDPAHELWAPLGETRSAEARAALRDHSLFALADTAMRGAAVSNATYNAAGNVMLSLAGGPSGATSALAVRSRRYAEIELRRYFLAAREAGENTATPRSLAALLADLARGGVPGLSREGADAARAALLLRRDPEHGMLYAKDGALDTPPACRVRSGFLEDRSGSWIWVVMGCAEDGANVRGDQVDALVEGAFSIVLERVRLVRAGAGADFERRAGFVAEGARAEALPARSAGSLRGASSAARCAAFLGAEEGDRVAVLGLPSIEAALALAEDVGPKGRVIADDPRPALSRALAAEARREGLVQVEVQTLAGARAGLALHRPERGVDEAGRRSAATVLFSALQPGGVAVIVLEGAAVPSEPPARREQLSSWWDASLAAGFERGRTWRWPRGETFVIELRRPE